MEAGRPILFWGHPITKYQHGSCSAADIISRHAGKLRIRARTGNAQSWQSMELRDAIGRWQRGRAKLIVTDCHIRNSQIAHLLGTESISDANLLPLARDADIRSLEMLTLVISTAGMVTDSHTDDQDGSNHCYCGRKLWLAWDALNGFNNGLEDVSRFDVYDQAAFTLEGFLRTRGSRWFIVESGQTLFLPANYAHKVVTLDDYIGVGSFFVIFPAVARLFHEWHRLPPIWSTASNNLLRKLANFILERASQYASLSRKERFRLGLSTFQRSHVANERLKAAVGLT